MSDTTQSHNPIAVGAEGAASMFDVSESTWRRWVSAGLVPGPVRVGGNRAQRPQDDDAVLQQREGAGGEDADRGCCGVIA